MKSIRIRKLVDLTSVRIAHECIPDIKPRKRYNHGYYGQQNERL